MRHLLGDLRSGVRMLVKYPTLSIVAIGTFGIGIGLTTTAFSVINGALFQGLPFPDAGRVVKFMRTNPSAHESDMSISVQDLDVFKQRLTVFSSFGEYSTTALNLSMEAHRPERYSSGQMTVAAWETLGVTPAMGRGFQAGDDRPGAEAIVILSDDVWRTRFDANPNVVGTSVRTNGINRRIIGVMPPRFGFPERETLWVPLTINPVVPPRGQGPEYEVVARLAPGVTLQRAQTEAAGIARQLATDFPQTNKNLSADVQSFSRAALGDEPIALLNTMLGAAFGVLLIACVNVSNLLIARASMRRKEFAVRMALGAARRRVVAQHLTEVLVLAAIGAVIGLGVNQIAMKWFVDALSADPPPFWMTFETDYRVLAFVAGIVALACLAAGGLPAAFASRVNAGAVMKDDSRSSTSARLGRFSAAIVVVELALSCGLLIAAGLMIKSVAQLKFVKMPFAVDNILTARLSLPVDNYKTPADCVRFYEQLLPRIKAVSGVEAATMSDGLPAAGNGAVPIQLDGQAYTQDSDYPVIREGIVMPGYFETFQVPLVSGREFVPGDSATGQPVAMVNASFVRRFFKDGDPVGRRFRRGRGDVKNPWLTIVGVAPDLLMQGIGNNDESPVGYYIPIAQSDVGRAVNIALRTRGDAAAMTPALRGAVASLDDDLAVYNVQSMDAIIRTRTWFYTVFGTFFAAFGLSALILASAGLYGVMSFAVTQRTREMCVRSALGAQGHQLIGLVMRRSIIQLAIGLVFGVLIALAASDPLRIVLYYVDPRDPIVFAVVVLALAISGLAASYIPARRVTKIDPAVALAAE
jgi:putative ABC transport system permease protein